MTEFIGGALGNVVEPSSDVFNKSAVAIAARLRKTWVLNDFRVLSTH